MGHYATRSLDSDSSVVVKLWTWSVYPEVTETRRIPGTTRAGALTQC